MAVTIPTITELYNQILNDIASEFDVDVSELGITYQVQAKVRAGMLYQQYLALSGLQKNIFYDLAEESILVRYGEIILKRRPAPAEAGVYNVEVTGQVGAVISAGTQFRADDSTLAAGNLFIVDSKFTLTSTTDTLSIRSLSPGTDAALKLLDTLTSTAPIVNVDSSVKVIAITTAPIAAESITDYRADVIEKAQIEPQGGSPGDYKLWASEIPEVRNIYAFAKFGSPGDIEIYIEATADNTAPAEVIGVPTQATIDEVYLNNNGVESGAVVINPVTGKGRKPIGVFSISALPVNPVTVDLRFIGLTDTSKVSEIRTAIDALLYDIRPFVGGADQLVNKNDILTIGQVIAVVISVLANTGVTYTNLTIDVDGNEESSFQFFQGNYPYLNIIYNDGNAI